MLRKDLKEQERQKDDEEFIEDEWLSLDNIKSLVRNGKNISLLATLSLLDGTSY